MNKKTKNGLEFYSYENMEKAQELQLKLLSIVDEICNVNNLQYWLDAGSMLGAIRHKGFIPWDDDLDICLLKPDYDKLLHLLNERCKDDESIFLKFFKNNKSSSYIENFCSTEMVLEEVNGTLSPCHIDIFPMKLLKNNIEDKKLDNKTTDRALYFMSGKYRYDNSQKPDIINSKNDAITLKKKFFAFYNNNYMNRNYELKNFSGSILGYSYGSILKKSEFDYFNYDDVFPLKKTTINGFDTYVANNHNAYLNKLYGDFMKFPNVNQRVPFNIGAHYISDDKRTQIKNNYLRKTAVFNINYYFNLTPLSKFHMLFYYIRELGIISTIKGLKITRRIKQFSNKPVFNRIFIEK